MSGFGVTEIRLHEQDLVGKVAVVTGASKGIGRSILFNLACRGASVLGTFSSEASHRLFNDHVSQIQRLYSQSHQPSAPKVIGILADITSPDCAQTIADSLATHFDGRLDILVNNAAVTGGCRIGQTTAEFVEQKLFANVQTPILVVEELVRRKAFRPESRIVNISSDRARTSSKLSLVYSATKAALESLARTWALQFGGSDDAYAFMLATTANSVSVGATESDTAQRLPAEQRQQRMAVELERQVVTPTGRPYFAQCEEVADVVGLLCSEQARWITGSVIPANGGSAMIR